MFLGKLPSFEDACALVSKLHVEQNITFYDMELTFRKIGLPIYLFGEEPEKSRYTKGLNYGKDVFALMISVKRCRAFALADAESGCHDAKVNLERLKHTKMTLADGGMDEQKEMHAFVASQVELWCATPKMQYEAAYVPHVYAAFQSYLRANPDKQKILEAKQFVLCEMNPEQFTFHLKSPLDPTESN